MPILFLIRHGENDYLKRGRLPGQTPGIHLNERGREQAEALAQSLAGLPIKALYASPLERAVETAQPIARVLKLEIQSRPALMDGDTGAWTGKEIKKLGKNPAWKIVQAAPSRAQFPRGESILDVQTRVVKAIEAICADHKTGLAAVVFHADPIKLAVTYFLGLPLDHFQKLGVESGSVTVLAVSSMSAHLIALNLKPPFKFETAKKKK